MHKIAHKQIADRTIAIATTNPTIIGLVISPSRRNAFAVVA
jgi:hypothetical protein